MKKLVLLAFMSHAYAFTLPENARQKSMQAVLAYPKVKTAKKRVEKKVYRGIASVTGLNKKQMGVVIGTARSAMQGKVSTRVLKINMTLLGASVRPDLEYDWKNNSQAGTINIGWSW